MARLSAIETGKKLLTELRNFGGKLGHFGLEILRPVGNGLKVGFDWLFERGEKIYGSLEKRFGPVLRRWRGSLEAWWERRGWPPSLLRLFGYTLLYLPVDIGTYLFYCIGYFVRLNSRYLLAWLVFAGAVRAWWFYFEQIRPDQRKAARVKSAENGTQIEGGC